MLYTAILIDTETGKEEFVNEFYFAGKLNPRKVVYWKPPGESMRKPFRLKNCHRRYQNFDYIDPVPVRFHICKDFADNLLMSLKPKEKLWRETLSKDIKSKREIYVKP